MNFGNGAFRAPETFVRLIFDILRIYFPRADYLDQQAMSIGNVEPLSVNRSFAFTTLLVQLTHIVTLIPFLLSRISALNFCRGIGMFVARLTTPPQAWHLLTQA
jgi:hypothetical protein